MEREEFMSFSDPEEYVNNYLITNYKGIQAFDLILLEDHFMVVGQDGLFQFKLEDNQLELLSEVEAW